MGVDLCLCKYFLNLKIMNNKIYFLKEKKDSFHACKWVNYTSLTLIRKQPKCAGWWFWGIKDVRYLWNYLYIFRLRTLSLNHAWIPLISLLLHHLNFWMVYTHTWTSEWCVCVCVYILREAIPILTQHTLLKFWIGNLYLY